MGRGGQIAATLRDPHGCGQLSVSNYFLQEIGKRVLCSLCVSLPRAVKWVQQTNKSPPGRIEMVAPRRLLGHNERNFKEKQSKHVVMI